MTEFGYGYINYPALGKPATIIQPQLHVLLKLKRRIPTAYYFACANIILMSKRMKCIQNSKAAYHESPSMN